MRKRVQVALAISFLILVGVFAWQVLEPREPVYQGKTLSSWLSGYQRGVFQNGGGPPRLSEVIPPNADAAMLQAGTTALPTLLQMLRARDSVLKRKLMYLAKGQHLIKIEYTPAETLNWAALHAFHVLGAKAQSAVPGLIEIVNQRRSSPSQTCALGSLGAIGPPAKEAVPSLLRWATNADPGMRSGAISALCSISTETNRLLPVLINALHDKSPEVQNSAVNSLGRLGPDATPAVPALVEFVNANQNTAVRNNYPNDLYWNVCWAIDAFSAIGPSAKEAVPSMLRWVTNADPHLRLEVIVALGRVHADPDRVVPVLTDALHDPDKLVRINAADALGEFGPNATPAVPALVEFLNAQNDSLVRSWVAAALKKIDPEAAAKAGVK
jgi:HEAT repeat protein